MRKLFLLIVLTAFAANAQLNNVSIGYGSMTFPAQSSAEEFDNASPSQGGAAYLSIGFENGLGNLGGSAGATLFIGGDSRIQYGGEDYGSGMVGLAGFQNIELGSDFRFGVFVGALVFQTYERVDDEINVAVREGLRPLPELKEQNIQPFGGVKVGWKFIEVQYAPAGNTLTVGFKLL